MDAWFSTIPLGPPARQQQPTASERIRQARRAQQLAEYEHNGYPLALVRMLNAHPEITLDDALDGYSVRAQKVA